MSKLEMLGIRLFVAQELLRHLEGARADAEKAAVTPGAQLGAASYLEVAADLAKQISRQKKKIASLEKQREKLG